jgi:hypothetical protein
MSGEAVVWGHLRKRTISYVSADVTLYSIRGKCFAGPRYRTPNCGIFRRHRFGMEEHCSLTTDELCVALHSNAGKCARGSKNCIQFPEFAGLFVLKSGQKTMQAKKDSVIFVLISRTNFSRNFVRVLCVTVRDFSAVTRQSIPGKGLKTNKRDSGN